MDSAIYIHVHIQRYLPIYDTIGQKVNKKMDNYLLITSRNALGIYAVAILQSPGISTTTLC